MDGMSLAVVVMGAAILVGIGWMMGRGGRSVAIQGPEQTKAPVIYGQARIFRVLDQKNMKVLFEHRNFIQCWLIFRQFEKLGNKDKVTIQFSDSGGHWSTCKPDAHFENASREVVGPPLIVLFGT